MHHRIQKSPLLLKNKYPKNEMLELISRVLLILVPENGVFESGMKDISYELNADIPLNTSSRMLK